MKKILVNLVIVVALLLMTCSLAGAAVIFSDNFESGSFTNWTTQNGSWSIVTDGTKVFQQNTTGAEGRAWAKSGSSANQSVEMKVKVTNFNGSNRALVCARMLDGNNYYAVSITTTTLELRKKISGSTTVLTSKSMAFSVNTWYTIKLQVSGTTLTAYVNGTSQLTATDSARTSGVAGMVAWKVTARFDDVVVDDLGGGGGATPTPPTVTPTNTNSPTPSVGAPTPTNTNTPTPSAGAATPTNTNSPTPSAGGVTPSPVSGDIYCAPGASDSGAGTSSNPMSFTKAITSIAAGKTIWMMNGTYNYSAPVIIAEGNNGTSGAMKNVFAVSGATVTLDFSGESVSSSNRGVILAGNYWYFKNITMKKAGDNGMLLAGHYNKLESCKFLSNQDSGLQLSRYNTSYTSVSQWPHNNYILNCLSQDNLDTDNMGDADGYAPKLTSGNANVFEGCTASYNVDDGWDMYTKSDTGPNGPVTMRSCTASENGHNLAGTYGSSSNGNGFKLGDDVASVRHELYNCVASYNRGYGYEGNGNPAVFIWQNCTGTGNEKGYSNRMNQ